MALGALSSLGFGSGVLEQDTIDKLKKADEEARISPYTSRIESNTTKQKDIAELLTKLSAFRSSVSSLGDATIFAKRKVVASVTTNPPADLSVNSGVNVQSMRVSVTQLAQKDVYQSKALANENGYVNGALGANDNVDLTFFQNGKEYKVTINGNTTYKELAEKITEASGGEIVAKIVNTGEKGQPYRLTLTSKETGEDNAITFFPGAKNVDGKYDSSSIDSRAQDIFSNLGWELDDTTGDFDKKVGYQIKDDANDPKFHLQTAQNAEFTLDGIKMTRSSNTITDLGVGITLTLNSTGDINFDVQQDNSAVNEEIQKLVDAFNDLVVNLNAATDYNKETGTAGSLQGVSEVSSIRSSIINALFKSQLVDGKIIDENGSEVNSKVMLSMQDFGVSLNEAGNLAFDQTKFDEKVKELGSDFVESFFAGVTRYEELSHTGDLIQQNSLDKYTDPTGQDSDKGLAFKSGDFVIEFDGQSYDLSKNKDGTAFKLTGKNEQELLNNLINHIKDLGIEGLDVKIEQYDKDNQKGYNIKFKSEGNGDFAIKGDENFLKQFGLSETSITAKPIEGAGIFAKLKSIVDGISGTNGSLTKYDESLTKDTKSLNEAKENTQKLIDSRYETMQNQWLLYESVLNKLNTQLLAVQNMIQASNNQNNA
ncbi:flagellar filament capping protein FliD [Campylobacter cuniculorum]|uniref:Flagellar hook-associated protein 2 n=2 Tax=Campylobacter cuniculorum TaxID=374106 RepID=A0A1W6BZ08_9BACT|nr:flagellar filament capping protein FliD [Campylobacter cuniculorum]ARJ57312.1 flagellar filament cap protein [Campylobacter cuniculorum DSM 23162 = LMG 24588]QOR04747.1 flagellar filament capping protein FliD [Campylobacter cuniculorum]